MGNLDSTAVSTAPPHLVILLGRAGRLGGGGSARGGGRATAAAAAAAAAGGVAAGGVTRVGRADRPAVPAPALLPRLQSRDGLGAGAKCFASCETEKNTKVIFVCVA
jgi:hypothetical protein